MLLLLSLDDEIVVNLPTVFHGFSGTHSFIRHWVAGATFASARSVGRPMSAASVCVAQVLLRVLQVAGRGLLYDVSNQPQKWPLLKLPADFVVHLAACFGSHGFLLLFVLS